MSKQYAKEHSLDIPHFSCIEFPLKVKNVDKAFGLVGGKEAIIRSVQDEVTNPLELRFSKSIHEHPINAKSNKNEQILLKISVPKAELEKNNGNIRKTLKTLHEQQSAPVHIQPIAIINKTFRFREMADFQYQTKNSEFTQTIDHSIHDLKYSAIKNLEFGEDLKPWEPDAKTANGELYFDLPAPPRFSSIPLPFNYHYKKNAGTIIDKEGKLTIKNKHIKLFSIIIKWNEPSPIEASDALKAQLARFENDKINEFYIDILKTLELLRKLFEIKPIWIRKHLEANLPVPLKACLKYSLPQVAYTFTKGPWRQAYIKFGVDPRSSKEFAKYETEVFRVPGFNGSIPKGFMSEVPDGVSKVFKFNGKSLPSSLLFQLENLTDPLIVELLSKATFREEADFYDGWYDSLTMLKLRRLMRYKLKVLAEDTLFNEEKIDFILNGLRINESKDDENEDDGKDQSHIGGDIPEDDEEDEYEDYELDVSNANYNEIMKYLERLNPKGAKELGVLSDSIRLKDLEL